MGYTEAIATQEDRSRVRQATAVMSGSRIADAVRLAASVVYAVCGLVFVMVFMLLTLPLFFLRVRRRDAANISTQEGGSLTAVKALHARAVAAACGFGPDALAVQLIRRLSLTGETFGGWLFTQVYWRSLVFGFRLTHRIYAEQLAGLFLRSRMRFSEVAYLQLRTCWLDDVVDRFVQAQADRPAQLVILGAGYDTRCLRLALPDSVRRFEVDAPGTQTRKRALLRELGITDAAVTYVACDFARERWIDRLRAEGFDHKRPTCFVWEGVTMYLTRDVVESTLRDVSGCATGSVVGFDYLEHEWVSSPAMQAMMKRAGEPWQFGLRRGEAAGFVDDQGLRVLDHLGAEELLTRYVPHHADGSSIGWCGDFGGFVLAGV